LVAKRGLIRERVLRILLNSAEDKLTKYRIAKLSKGSFGWVHEFLNQLEREHIIRDTKVIDYKKLIHYWKECRTIPEKKEYMVTNPLEILHKTKLAYALTTYQAENLVQNYLFPSRIDFYIKPKDKEKWHRLLSKEGLVGKGNTRVLILDDDVFYGSFKTKGLNLVSVPQLIVDLLAEGGVCVEAAEKLLEKVLEHALPAVRD